MKSFILITLLAALVITGLACGGSAATPITTPTPAYITTPTPTLPATTASPATPPTAIPTPTPTVESNEEAGKALYEDPSGRFSVPIPTNWTAASAEGYGVLTDPDDKITVYVLAVESSDVEAAIVDAWALVDPGFDLEPNHVVEQPPTGGLEKVVNIDYHTGDESRVAGANGQLYQSVVYILLVRGDLIGFERRLSQVVIISTGFTISALEQEDLAGVEPLRLTDDLLVEFEAYIVDAMERFNIPGAAVAVVQEDEIVYANGFGLRELGKDDPVTPETLMMIGSITKSMTTLLMATLVDDGLMDWETPVVEVMPTFALADPELTQKITVRNLVCACTGVPRRDLEFFLNSDELSAEDIVESLATFELFTGFGEAFQYSNQMVATGGYLAAMAAGAEYGSLYNGYVQAAQERVFAPIGMTSTTLSFDEVQASNDYGTPHGLNLAFEHYPVPLQLEGFVTPVAPAGAVWSNVLDMGRYLITELNQGVAPDGTVVVSAQNLKLTWEPQVAVTASDAYGLGWLVGEYKGLPEISHGGATIGFSANLAFLPDQDLGIIILANAQGSGGFNHAIRSRLFELALGLESEFDEKATFGYQAARDAFAELAADLVGTDPDAVAPYLGRYTNDVLGQIIIELVDGKLIMDVGEFRSEVRSKADEDGEVTGYILSDGVGLGIPLQLTEADQGNPIVVLGEGVDEYTFQKVE